jgi:hypothetical protein
MTETLLIRYSDFLLSWSFGPVVRSPVVLGPVVPACPYLLSSIFYLPGGGSWPRLCCFPAMTGASRALEPAALSAENWEFLLNRTILYATGHVNRWRWRGSFGGVLPDGFSPNALAAEAIAELLQDSVQHPELLHLPVTDIQRSLERRVRRHVNRLHHRSENRLIRNEPDLIPITLDDGEAISIIELIEDPSPRPDKALLEKESQAEFDQFKSEFSAFLGKDRWLARLFELYCDGQSRPDDMISSLKLCRSTVKNLRRRFRRRWAEFHRGSFPTNGHSDEQSHAA